MNVVKTIAEFRDELRALRQEMFDNAEIADLHLVASWVDQLVISLEGLTHSLELMDVEVETLCGCCDNVPARASVPSPKAKPAKKKAKKPAKKAAKKPAKRKRR